MTFGSKKGNVLLDSVLFLIILFVFGIVGVIAYISFDDMVDDIDADPDVQEITKNETTALRDRFPATMDGAFALAFGLMWILVLVASFMIDSHPVFFVVSLILLIALLFASGYIANFYDEFNTDPEYAAASAQFPITTFVLENLMIFVLIIGGSIAIVLFGKNRLG